MFQDDLLLLDAMAEPTRSGLLRLIGLQHQLQCARFGPFHLLLALYDEAPEQVEAVLAPAMLNRQSPKTMASALRDGLTEPPAGTLPLHLRKDRFTPEALNVLNAWHGAFAKPGEGVSEPEAVVNERYPMVLKLLFDHAGESDLADVAYFLDPKKLGRAATQTASRSGESIFDAAGALIPNSLRSNAAAWLEEALLLAAQTGHEQCLLTHLLLAALQSKHALLQRTFRVFGQPDRIALTCRSILHRLQNVHSTTTRELAAASFSESCLIVLQRANTKSAPLDLTEIVAALLRSVDLDPFAQHALSDAQLNLNPEDAAAYLERSFQRREASGGKSYNGASGPLASLEDLTARFGGPEAVGRVDREQSTQLERGLYSVETPIVLLHGEPGVGCTALVESAAQKAAQSSGSFLTDALFLRADAADILEAERAPRFRRILAAASDEEKVVLCIENFQLVVECCREAILRLPARARVIGIIPDAAYHSRIAPDAELNARVFPVAVPPADHETTLKILDAISPSLAAEYGATFKPAEWLRVIQLAERFLTQERLPKSAVTLLRRACDEARFEKMQSQRSVPVGVELAQKVVAQQAGLDLQQITGAGGAAFYRERLSRNVVGQEGAVSLAAECLQKIHRTHRSDERPAAIFLFAGQTGVGKTLLAQEIAKLYSTNGMIHSFAMGEFKTRETANRLTGASPGYVGYEEGGALVNALIKQPNSVVLFDEVDKAHPDVWDVCLQLFGAGWLKDARGRKAWGTQAIFVLTTNVGQEVINRELARIPRPSNDAISVMALDQLRRERHNESGRPRFRQEFLARIDHTIVFEPLSAAALLKIAHLEIEKLVQAQIKGRSLHLASEDGSWSRLAALLHARSDHVNKNGRALDQELQALVGPPLSRFQVPNDRPLNVVLSIEGPAGEETLVFQGNNGERFTTGDSDS